MTPPTPAVAPVATRTRTPILGNLHHHHQPNTTSSEPANVLQWQKTDKYSTLPLLFLHFSRHFSTTFSTSRTVKDNKATLFSTTSLLVITQNTHPTAPRQQVNRFSKEYPYAYSLPIPHPLVNLRKPSTTSPTKPTAPPRLYCRPSPPNQQLQTCSGIIRPKQPSSIP